MYCHTVHVGFIWLKIHIQKLLLMNTKFLVELHHMTFDHLINLVSIWTGPFFFDWVCTVLLSCFIFLLFNRFSACCLQWIGPEGILSWQHCIAVPNNAVWVASHEVLRYSHNTIKLSSGHSTAGALHYLHPKLFLLYLTTDWKRHLTQWPLSRSAPVLSWDLGPVNNWISWMSVMGSLH